MAAVPGLQNALAWAHFRLKGGWKTLWGAAIGYFVIIGGLILFTLRIDPTSMDDILHGWMWGLTALQIGILLLFAGGAVRNAVRKDFTTGMLGSHRLMPISGTEAVAGYLIGSTPQSLAVAGANLALGVLVAAGAKVPIINWLAANLLLAVFAVCAWVVMVCMAFLTPKSAGLLVVLVVIVGTTGGAALTGLPALTVVCSPIIGGTVFGVMQSGLTWNWAYQISLLGQFAIAILAFVAAARKFRRDDVLAMGPLLGLAHLAVWVVLSITGIAYWDDFRPVFGMRGRDIAHIQMITSTLGMTLVAIIPLSSAAWLQTDYRRRRRLSDPSLGHRHISSAAVALAATVVVLALPALTTPLQEVDVDRVVRTGITLAATLLPISYLLRILYRVKGKPGVLVALWIGLTWAGPWIVHFAILIARGQEPEEHELISTVSTCSPIGSLTVIWSELQVDTTIGLAFQAALAAGMAALFYATQKRSKLDHVPVTG